MRCAHQKRPHWAAAELAQLPPTPVPRAWGGWWKTGGAVDHLTFRTAERLTSKYQRRPLSDLPSPVRATRRQASNAVAPRRSIAPRLRLSPEAWRCRNREVLALLLRSPECCSV